MFIVIALVIRNRATQLSPVSYNSLSLTFAFSPPKFFLFTTLNYFVTNSSSLFTLSTFSLVLPTGYDYPIFVTLLHW